jgi:glycosyltransferase involved in cell wall biosynthesis
MKVLHVYRTYYPDQPSGIAEAIRQTCLSTRPLGVESTIFTLSPRPRQNHPAPEARLVRARSWTAPASCDLGGPDAFQTFSTLAQEAGVIHYHYPWPFGDLLHLTVQPAAPAVLTWHSDIVRQKVFERIYRPLMDAMLRRVTLIAATSPVYARTSPTLTRAEVRDRVRVVPLGVEESSLPAAADKDIVSRLGVRGPFILFLGAMRYYKGLTFLLEAARLAGIPLVLAGGGPELAAMRQLAAQKQLSQVFFAGHVSESEKLALLRDCRAVVLPSHLRSEAYGMALVEATLCAKPMISCEIGTGTSYVNLDGVTGYVVPPRDADALGRALRALTEDAELASRFGIAARARYQELFSGPATARAHHALYEEALSTRKAAPARRSMAT